MHINGRYSGIVCNTIDGWWLNVFISCSTGGICVVYLYKTFFLLLGLRNLKVDEVKVF